MLRMITGKIGGGKTYYAVREIIDELVNGERTVVTNVALELGPLNEYIQQHYPDANVNLFERVRILDESETLQFYLHRHHGVDVEPVTKEEERRGEFPTFPDEAFTRGVFYVLDEVHTYFNCRNWMNVGLTCSWYLAQHRKFDDEIIAISQFSDQIDKQFKGFAQYWLHIVNNGNELMAGFRGANYCVAKWYNQEKRGFFDKAQSVERYRIDKRIGACYDTSAGTGIKGRKRTETRRKRKGLSPIYLIPAGILGIAALIAAPRLLAAGTSKLMGGVLAGVQDVQEGAAERYTGPVTARAVDPGPVVDPGERPEVVGVMQLSGLIHLWISDGRRYALPPGAVSVGPTSVRVQGEIIPMRSRYAYQGLDRDPYAPSGATAGRAEGWDPRRL